MTASTSSQTIVDDSHDLSNPVFYLWHETFESADGDSLLFMPAGESIYAEESSSVTQTSSGDYDVLRGLPLLSPQGETFLFRKMNYLKYCAEQTRVRLLGSSNQDDAAEYERLLADANAVRNQIAECNLRLVISITRKFTTSVCDFDELMSEGNEILLKAIGKFDCSRGFRFSTYATHSVQRHFYRYTQRQQKRKTVESMSAPELLSEVPGTETDEAIAEWIREEQRMTVLLSRMAERLDEREQRIVVERFGLSGQGVTKTLRELSSEMGLSKERIRQLQMVAVEKLRGLFDELAPETSWC